MTSDLPSIPQPPSKSRYLGTWALAQLPLVPLVWALKGKLLMLAGVWPLVTSFGIRVWKEVEDDAVNGMAQVLRAMPAKALDLAVRLRDVFAGGLRAWSPGFTRRYLRELYRTYGLFNDKGLGLINANRLDLDKVYVELRAAGDVNLNHPTLNPTTRIVRGRAAIWEHLPPLRPGFALAVIGPPGSGKTTLLQHMLLTYARNRQWRRKMRGRVPFLIELRRVADRLVVDQPPTLTELLAQVLEERLPGLPRPIPTGWLAARLASGRCLLLWDGLDEVAEVAQRQRVSAWLDAQITAGAETGTLSIVSARPAGYAAAPLERAHVLEVQPFDHDDTRRFIAQWYHANEVVSHGLRDNEEVRRRAQEGARDLMERLGQKPQLAALTGNPLLLTMVCMVHRYHGALPGSRAQLYAEICQVLLERWRQARGLQDEYRGEQKLEVLRVLAAHMMEQERKELPEEDVLQVVAAPLALIGVAAADARAFLHRLQEGSGLLLEQESKRWSFAHLSLQEYLCADGWVQRPEAAPQTWDEKVGSSWWRETLLLYASRARDASAMVTSALVARTPQALALVLAVRGEKPNLNPEVREQLEQALTKALASRESYLFRRAAEALLWQHHEVGYRSIGDNDEPQLGSWVTQAEYQLFMLETGKAHALIPLHWPMSWFQGAPDTPIVGISSRAAAAYCIWLDQRFPEWAHRLPRADELGRMATESIAQPIAPVVAEGLLLTPTAAQAIQDAIAAWQRRAGWHTHGRYDARLDREAAMLRALTEPAKSHGDITRSILVGILTRYPAAMSVRGEPEKYEINPEPIGPLASAIGPSLGLAATVAEMVAHGLYRPFWLAGSLARTRAQAQQIAPAYQLDLDPTQGLDLAVDPKDLSAARQRLEQWQQSKEQRLRRRARSLVPLFEVIEADTIFAARAAWQRYFCVLFDIIREHDPTLITDDLFPVEAAIRILVAREQGQLPAWEGLRIVRRKRTLS